MSARKSPTRSDHALPDGDPSSIVRRAPFADSPYVGERGQKAQIRILEAALEVFGEVGYQRCGVKRITELSGYSRASFYQYFSSKEDLFRHLAGRVARELNESADALEPVTGDLAGWQAFFGWLERYSAIYDAYEPVFVTFQTAVVSDEMVASGASVVAARTVKRLRSKIKGSPLPAGEIETVLRMLLKTVARLNREAELLEMVAPRSSLTRRRMNIAYADAFHRVLFGPVEGVNIHTSTKRLKPLARPARSTEAAGSAGAAHGPAAQRTRTQLIEAGHKVFVERGYYATRVADIVEAAGVSHGVFYRYFDNKAGLFRILAEQASHRLSGALDDIPDLTAGGTEAQTQLRAWLRLYANTYAEEASIFTMWSEATTRGDELGTVSGAVIDGSRARLARHLEPRGWGDADADGLVLTVFLDAMTSQRITTAHIDNVAEMIERGLLTGPNNRGKGNGSKGNGASRSSAARARGSKAR
ncbi:MAG: TetR/AcrR family transcriptional regulator [Acidimicrobiales bacterium]